MKRKFMVIILVVLMLFALVLQGCSSETGGETEEEGQKDQKPQITMLRSVTGAAGGLWQVYGTAWGQLVDDKNNNITVQVEAGGGGYANIVEVDADPQTIGMTQNAAAYEGYRGLSWAEGTEYQNIRGLFPVYPSSLHFWAPASAGIKTIEDFEGKVVSVGPAGGTDVNVRELFEILGVKPKEFINQNWSDMVQGIKDGLIDGVCVSSGHPHSSISELEQSIEISHIAPTKEQIDLVTSNAPYYSIVEMPADTYKDLDKDIDILAFYSFAICHKDLDEDVAYAITKTVLENNDQLVAAVEAAKDTILDNADEIKFYLHPGAVRYYEEVGFELSDDVYPPEMQ